MGIVQSALWAAPEEAGNVWKLGLNRQWAKRWMLLCGRNLFYWANEKVGATPRIHPHAPHLSGRRLAEVC
jgi:hypothetical protein